MAQVEALMRSEPGFWEQVARANALNIQLESAKDLAFVWEEDGDILGYTCAHDLGFRAYLSELIVAEDARGRNIGRQLLQHIEDSLRERRCPVLFADVWKDAESFYKALGWSAPDVTLLRKRLDVESNTPRD